MKTGVPPTDLKARTGELTPPGNRALARSKSVEDRGRLEEPGFVAIPSVAAPPLVFAIRPGFRIVLALARVGLFVLGGLVGARFVAEIFGGQRLPLLLGAGGRHLRRN